MRRMPGRNTNRQRELRIITILSRGFRHMSDLVLCLLLLELQLLLLHPTSNNLLRQPVHQPNPNGKLTLMKTLAKSIIPMELPPLGVVLPIFHRMTLTTKIRRRDKPNAAYRSKQILLANPKRKRRTRLEARIKIPNHSTPTRLKPSPPSKVSSSPRTFHPLPSGTTSCALAPATRDGKPAPPSGNASKHWPSIKRNAPMNCGM